MTSTMVCSLCGQGLDGGPTCPGCGRTIVVHGAVPDSAAPKAAPPDAPPPDTAPESESASADEGPAPGSTYGPRARQTFAVQVRSAGADQQSPGYRPSSQVTQSSWSSTLIPQMARNPSEPSKLVLSPPSSLKKRWSRLAVPPD